MKTLFGAVAGALALGAVLVAYDLGERHTFNRDAAAMALGYQAGQPYAMPVGQTGYAAPYAPYGTQFAAQYPYGAAAPMAPLMIRPRRNGAPHLGHHQGRTAGTTRARNTAASARRVAKLRRKCQRRARAGITMEDAPGPSKEGVMSNGAA